jgi:predicted ferric reductase
MSKRRANWILWLLGIAPILIALLYLHASDGRSPGAVLNLLGRLTGIGGLAFLLVAAILSCRVPGFDRPFGGLTKLWQTHHKLGGVALLLLLAHPVLLALAAAEVSLSAAAQTLIPAGLQWPTLWGWLALLVMMVFLAPSFAFFGEPEYQRWRNIHRLAAVAVVAGLAHTFLVARTIAEPVNTVIWLVLAIAAVAAVAYRLVFSRGVGRLSYSVAEVARPAKNIVELSLDPRGQHLTHEAGQFVYLAPYDRTLAAGCGEEHPYTLSSAPGEPCLRVAIKDLGDASRAIQRISLGSEVRIEGPYGDFFADSGPGTAEIWIAGGIGITPFLGRARHFARLAEGGGEDSDAHLVYCVQDEARAHFHDELRELADRLPGLRLTMHYFYREGPLRREFLDEHCPDFRERQAYTCGPNPLMNLAIDILTDADVPRDRIHSEEFQLL